MTGGGSPRSGNSSPIFGSPSPSPSRLATPAQLDRAEQSSLVAAAAAGADNNQHVAEPSDVPHLIRTHETLGYRAGLSDGKDSAGGVQAAFDQGYPLGAVLGFKVGWLLRRLAEIESMSHNGHSDRLNQDRHNSRPTLQDAAHELSISKLMEQVEELRGLDHLQQPAPSQTTHHPQQSHVTPAELVGKLPAIVKWTEIALEKFPDSSKISIK